MAVNPVTNKIYVVNSGIQLAPGNTVTVIDAANNNSTTTVTVGTFPVAVAVNASTNQIYVASFSSNNVTVIDGATNSTTAVGVGTTPIDIAVNPVMTRAVFTLGFQQAEELNQALPTSADAELLGGTPSSSSHRLLAEIVAARTATTAA